MPGCCSGDAAPAAAACCGAGPTRDSGSRTVTVEFLYLDLERCSRCRETERVLEEALAEVGPVLRTTGVELELRKVHVQNEEQAREVGLVTSPTIRINGRDLEEELQESLCNDCSDLCGDEVNCRVWSYRGEEYPVPPKALLVEALLRAAYGQWEEAGTPAGKRGVPENLRRFFRRRSSEGG